MRVCVCVCARVCLRVCVSVCARARACVCVKQSSAEAAVEASDRIFSEMMVSIERRRSELKEVIRDQQQTAVAQTEALLRQLEEHMEQLERRHADLEELSNTDDSITFIQVPLMDFTVWFSLN